MPTKRERYGPAPRATGYTGFPPGANRYAVHAYRNDPDDIYSLNNDNIYAVGGDSRGRIWIGTWGGGINMLENPRQDRGRFLHHHNELKNYPIDKTAYIRHIGPERAGKLWAGTSMGLLVFNADTEVPQQTVFHLYGQEDTAGKSLINSNIHYVCSGSHGVFLATGGGGVSRVSAWDREGFPAGFQSYTRKDGLPSDNILSIAESADGYLWVCSEENITRFDPATGRFRNFDETNQLIRNGLIFEASVLFSRRTGKMKVGYSHGILVFTPEELVHSSFVPPSFLPA
ncbi:MAG: hypothetical protein LUD68_06280 [Rikenellaceae bacterium]|nr:hypothetical protein [Rikenellaceae bacterium]